MRKVYALGLQITTVGPNDGNGLFAHFLIANGGEDIVTRDGKLHTDDPQVREAAIRSVTYMTTAYKEGYVPPEALSWNDADDNNAYHEKLFVMDFDGTLSTELAMIKNKKAYYEEMVVMGLPNTNDGKPMRPRSGAGGGFIPKGAKNIAVAKDFMKFFMQPEVMNENLKNGLGRWVPVIPADCERRSVVDGHQERPAPGRLMCMKRCWADLPGFRRIQSSLGPGECRAALGCRSCRCYQERNDAGGSGGQGVQASRGDLREIHPGVTLTKRITGMSDQAILAGLLAPGSATTPVPMDDELFRTAS